jgi:hypothetical protein
MAQAGVQIDRRVGSEQYARTRTFNQAAFATALLISCLFNVALLFRRLHWSCPLSPWEAGMIADGWRALHHQPTYSVDHATNMYGALLNVSSALIFRLVGVNNYALRIFELLCYCAAAGVLARAVARRGWRLTAFALISLAAIPTGVYWVMPNPDGAALLFSVCALVFADRRRWLLSTVAIVLGFSFKQPSALVAVIPLFGDLPRPPARAWIPLAGCALAALCIRLFFPLVYLYGFTVPQLAPFVPYRLFKAPVDVLVGLPVLLVALATWKPSWNRLERWLITAMAISLIAGAVMAARVGGGPNSFMLFVVAALAFCTYRLPELAESKIAAFAVLLTAFAYGGMSIGASGEHQGDARYHAVINIVRDLPGKVVAPEDPTIPMYAGKGVGTDLNMELDASGQWSAPPVPERTAQELRNADWVVTSDVVFGTKRLPDSELQNLGFVPAAIPQLAGSAYKVWHRTLLKTAP